MADISKITLPDKKTYSFKDQTARDKLNALPTSYYTKSEVDKKIPDTSSFQNATQVNSAIDTKLNSKITISTADPTGGSNGDLWFKYEA